jgi:hypothetical protein
MHLLLYPAVCVLRERGTYTCVASVLLHALVLLLQLTAFVRRRLTSDAAVVSSSSERRSATNRLALHSPMTFGGMLSAAEGVQCVLSIMGRK